MRKLTIVLCVCLLLLSWSTANAKEPIKFCLAKDDTFPSSKEHKMLMKKLGMNCATVYWKLNANDNLKHPYDWVRYEYLDEGHEVILVLLVDDGAKTVAIGEDSGKAIGNLQKVLDGHYDVALKDFAAKIARDARPVKIRLFPEFDGYWFPWGIHAEGNSTKMFIDAFAHVMLLFLFEEGISETVTFDANPNRRDGNKKVLGDARKYTPTINRLVDSYSVTSYDRGGTSITHVFPKSFQYEFRPAYDGLAELIDDQCINVAEVSTAGSYGRSKIKWFAEMLEDIENDFPRICEITFFFGEGTATNGSKIDWSLREEDHEDFRVLLENHRKKRSIKPLEDSP